MDKEIIIIRTKSGHKYAEAVAKKINNLGVECSKIVCWEDLESFMEQNECSPENTLFHDRIFNRETCFKSIFWLH